MTFAPVLNLSDLDGRNGFVINSAGSFYSGRSVSNAGDINGDGFDDVIIGEPFAESNPNSIYGESYIVFGGQDFSSGNFELSDLDGQNGFVVINSAVSGRAGSAVSTAGDINGDGIDDFIVGAPTVAENNVYGIGESYVVFGGQDFSSGVFDVAELDGQNGFVFSGIKESGNAGGSVRNAGDINNDGIDDLIIGTGIFGDANESYVVFGSRDGFDARFNSSDLNGQNGFVISGISGYDRFGRSVSNAGDVNGDGIDDLIIGAPDVDPSARDPYNFNGRAGTSYVIFGGQDFSSGGFAVAELNGQNGFVINGVDQNDLSGSTVSSAGDINGDGLDDLLIGAPQADANGNRVVGTPYVGDIYVIFGSREFSDDSLNLSALDGVNGFVVNDIAGIGNYDRHMNAAGDVNGDGIDDLIIGAPSSNPNNIVDAGETYVIFGDQNFDRSFDTSELDGRNGFILNGINEGDRSGASVDSAGDINGDGIDDLIIGNDSFNDGGTAEETYVVFGRASNAPSLNTDSAFTIVENIPFVTDIEAIDDLDSEGNGLTYQISGGADQTVFRIAADSGELTFTEVPNFENPIDSDRDNTYELEITVTDSDGLSDTNQLVIDIVDSSTTLVNLSILNGRNGFVINGLDDSDRFGFSVSNAGDVNDDDIDDLIIGTSDGVYNSDTDEGYVVFGKQTFSDGSFDLSELDGLNGFAINGINAYAYSGALVSNAGDVNGDGIDDIIVSPTNSLSSSKEIYVVFGGQDFSDDGFDLTTINGRNGFTIRGTDLSNTFPFDNPVSNAGDVNGDGIDDLIIGAPYASPNGNYDAGESYVVFGGQDFSSSSFDLSELDGRNGFVITGVDAYDESGRSVSNAGDINGDGIDDLIIGALGNYPSSNERAGKSYVVFGGQNFSSSFSLAELDGQNGFAMIGIDTGDSSGWSVSSAGDINGDGIDDLIIGAPFADPNNNADNFGDNAGESYVVFGGQNFSSSFDLSQLDGRNGFVISGLNTDDRLGSSVSNAEDVNGDGIDDLIIGVPGGYSYDSKNAAGSAYVVFGGQDFSNGLDLSSLDDSSGLVINGIDGRDFFGSSVSNAGDVNADGIGDLIIGAPGADPNGLDRAGESYVVFGRSPSAPILDISTVSVVVENEAFVFDIDAADNFDIENNGLIYRITDGADQALFTIDALTGELSFITAPDFENPNDTNGDNTYEVEVSVTNSVDLSDTQLLTINVVDVDEGTGNEAPVAVDDAVSTDANIAVTFDVLDNDTDPDSDTLSLSGITQPINGSASITADGTLTYTPNPDFSGSDSFTYEVSDGELTDTATVNTPTF